MSAETIETLSEAKRLSAATPADLASVKDEDIRGCFGDDTQVHRGDLSIEGDLDVHGGALIVLGNLSVTGSVATDETGSLIVTGSLQCRHLFLEGNLEVHGDATMRGVLYGFYEAGLSYVHGTARAKVGLIGNHAWECEHEVYETGGTFSNYRTGSYTGDPEALRKAIGDHAFKELGTMLGLSEEEPQDGNAAWGLRLFEDV